MIWGSARDWQQEIEEVTEEAVAGVPWHDEMRKRSHCDPCAEEYHSRHCRRLVWGHRDEIVPHAGEEAVVDLCCHVLQASWSPAFQAWMVKGEVAGLEGR